MLLCGAYDAAFLNPLSAALAKLNIPTASLPLRPFTIPDDKGQYLEHRERDALAALEKLHRANKEVILLGYSIGGYIAARVLGKQKAAASALILISAPSSLARLCASSPDSFLHIHVKVFKSAEAGLSFVDEVKAMDPIDEAEGAAHGLSTPTLMIYGSQDQNVPVAEGTRLRRSIGQAATMVVLNSDHYFRGKEDEIAQSVHQFLQTL